ncbi:Uncharacterised protein [Candidatus Anstonella stagnisolia]|nr:Uncharacterised protein [Candidatus Anstonella stagnisolia]
MVKCETVNYHIVCIPNWQDAAKEVNTILEKNKNMQILETKSSTVPFYRKMAETNCPKCDCLILPNRALNTGGICLRCDRHYTQEEFGFLTTVTYQQVGVFFMVELWLQKTPTA